MSKLFDQNARERAAIRRSWPVHAYPLGSEPSDDLSATTTPEERLAMMWPLAIEAWTLAGKAVLEYPRSEIPVRVIRRQLS